MPFVNSGSPTMQRPCLTSAVPFLRNDRRRTSKLCGEFGLPGHHLLCKGGEWLATETNPSRKIRILKGEIELSWPKCDVC